MLLDWNYLVLNVTMDGDTTGGTIWRNIIGNQCLRKLEGDIALAPYHGTYSQANVHCLFKDFRDPLLAHACPPKNDSEKFGQAAVQASSISQRAVRPELYDELELTAGASSLSVTGDSIEETAIKKAQAKAAVDLRLYNASASIQDVKVQTGFSLSRAAKARADESEQFELTVSDNSIKLKTDPFEIVTLLLYPL